jgi:hypothetical protein
VVSEQAHPTGFPAPEAWWAGRLAAVLGGLLDAGEAELEPVTQLMAFGAARAPWRPARRNLAGLGRLLGAGAVDEARGSAGSSTTATDGWRRPRAG